MSEQRKRAGGRRRRGEEGQALVFFIVFLVALLSFCGLLLDGGLAWLNRRQAQNAADMAARAAGRAVSVASQTCYAQGKATALSAATSGAGANGFSSVTVSYPPASGRFSGNCGYVQVSVARFVTTGFARVAGINEWSISATAVADVPVVTTVTVTECQLCALRTTNSKHTIVVEGAADITLDGGIYVNGDNVEKADCWKNGQALYVSWASGAGGLGACGSPPNPEVRILAETVRVVGGWRTDKGSIIQARRLADSADYPPSVCSATPANHPDLAGYQEYSPPIVGNICTNEPVLADPLASLPVPDFSRYTVRHGSAASPNQLVLDSGTVTLDPGIYYGGIKATERAHIVLKPGEYLLTDKALVLDKQASITANNVFIYTTSGNSSDKSGPINIRTDGSVRLSPMNTGTYAGILIFQDRRSPEPVILDPNNSTQCATRKGCIGDIEGTIYAADDEASVFFKASGETSLRIVSGRIRLGKGTQTTLHWPGALSTVTVLPPPSLVE